jgi:hypothetical protein
MLKLRIKKALYPHREKHWVMLPDHYYGFVYFCGYLITIKIRRNNDRNSKGHPEQ